MDVDEMKEQMHGIQVVDMMEDQMQHMWVVHTDDVMEEQMPDDVMEETLLDDVMEEQMPDDVMEEQ